MENWNLLFEKKKKKHENLREIWFSGYFSLILNSLQYDLKNKEEWKLSFLNYEKMLKKSDNKDLIIKEKPLLSSDGRIKGNKIAIRHTIKTQTEKSCVLAEELGHYYTTSGNILDQTDVSNRKQEYRARLYGFNLKIGLMGLIRAFEHGCRSASDIAE